MTLEGDQLSSHPLGPQWGLPRPLTSRCQQLSSRQNFKKHFNEHWSKGMRGASTRIRHRTRATLSGNQHFATCSRFPRLKTWGLQSNSCHQVLIYHITVALCQYLNPLNLISLLLHYYISQVQYLSKHYFCDVPQGFTSTRSQPR